MDIWFRFFTVLVIWITISCNVSGQSNREIDSLNQTLQQVKTINQRVETLYSLAEEWAEISFDSSYHYAKQIQDLADGNDIHQIYGYRAIGLAFDYAYQMDSAAHYYQQALDIAQKIRDTSNMALVKFNLGTVELLNGNYIGVLPWYNQAIELLENSNDDEGLLLNIFNNLGIVYRRIDRYEDAKNIYQRAINLLDPDKDKETRSDIFINMGNVMISLEQYDTAEYYYKEVITFAEEQNNRLDLAFANNGLGMVEESRGNDQIAIHYFDKVINEKDIEDDYVLFTALRFKAELLSKLGAYDSATYYFGQAHQIFEVEEYPDEIKDLYLQLAEHYERLGTLHLAIDFFRKHYSLKDQLVSEEVIDRTSEWEERYQAQERENEIINLRLQNEAASLQSQQQKNERNILIFLSLGLIGIVGFSFYMYQLKQNVNKSLEEKNRVIQKALADKELLMKEIHHRVKNNLQVISSLLNLQSNFIIDEKANAAMLDSKNRVHSMALIHQRLYQNENLTEIDLEEYLDQLISNLEQSYASNENEVAIALESSTIMMDADKVILVGLIVNELVTNSYKYAFGDVKKGKIVISLVEVSDDLELTVFDNGCGMDAPPEIKKGSLGTLLINDLSKKLKATLSYDLTGGTSVTIRFPFKRNYA